MKRSILWFALTATLLLVTVAAVAQPGTGPGRRGAGGGPGTGCMACANLDLTTVETMTGTLVSLEGGPGEGVPTLTLKDGDDTMEIVIGPYRLWAASGLEIHPGEEVTVTFATCDKTGHRVAMAVKDEKTGRTVQLRDPETGKPLVSGHRGRRS
ncbi:MAG TPA: hypothetical protein VLE27_00755 [Thermoanaerobaculia bacterium]|nr:hypothetical protein [Thermoanaerobaculia bacterium]